MKPAIGLILLLCWLPVDCLHAAASSDKIEETVVLGSRIPGADQSGNVEIIDRDALSRLGAAPVTRVLSQSRSIYVDANAGSGSINSLYLRGADPNMTQIQIDGVPVNDPTNSRGGSYDLGALNAEMIERIEILPISSSALYGSQANAGVVNIVTRDSVDAGRISLSGNSLGGADVSILTGAENVMFSGYLDNAGEDVEGSNYRSRGVFGRLSLEPRDEDKLVLGGRYQDADASAYPDDSGGDRYAVNRDLEKRKPEEGQLNLLYRYKPPLPGWLLLRGSYFKHSEPITSPAVAPGIRDPAGLPSTSTDNDYSRRDLQLQYLSADYKRVRFILGTEWYEEKGSSDGDLDFGFFQLPVDFALDRDSFGLFGEFLLRPREDIELNLGGRYDHYSRDSTFLPRVSVVKSFSNGSQRLYFNWGKGYKLPSFYALGHPLIGDPNLLPETSESYEVGYGIERSGLNLKIALFTSRFKNLIDFDAGPPPRLVNRDAVASTGMEASASGRVRENISWNAFYSYVDARIEGNGTELRKRPRHRAGVAVDWRQSDMWRWQMQLRYVSSQLDSSIPTGDRRLPAYFRADISSQWQLSENIQFFAGIDNLLDREYENSIGNPVKGRVFRLGLRYRI